MWRGNSLRISLIGWGAVPNLAGPPFELPAMIEWMLLPKLLRRLHAFEPHTTDHRDFILA
jgi:hypothetical protein